MGRNHMLFIMFIKDGGRERDGNGFCLPGNLHMAADVLLSSALSNYAFALVLLIRWAV